MKESMCDVFGFGLPPVNMDARLQEFLKFSGVSYASCIADQFRDAGVRTVSDYHRYRTEHMSEGGFANALLENIERLDFAIDFRAWTFRRLRKYYEKAVLSKED
jgi:hypothetical protein